MWTVPSLPNSGTLDYAGSKLLIPEAIIPETYTENRRSLLSKQPERRLMRAVLESAVMLYRRTLINTAKAKKIKGQNTEKILRECEEWFSGNDNVWYYSFENICDVLELNPGNIRRGLGNWKKIVLEGRGRATIPYLQIGNTRSVSHHRVIENRSYKKPRK